MKKTHQTMGLHVLPIERLASGVKRLDEVLGGGLVKNSVTVFAGSPGAGKTTLAQQICFNNASLHNKAVIFHTLSEPSAKTMRYMGQFKFFDVTKLNESIEYVDLGAVLRKSGVEAAVKRLTEEVRRLNPALVIIDSFKVFEDFADSREQLRKFSYDIAVQLMAWEVTAFLLGEYSDFDIESSPLFSVVDGIISMKATNANGDAQRSLRVIKMRGANHVCDAHPFAITNNGCEVSKRPTAGSSQARALNNAKR
jgi:circadian clock protein KaiC